MELGSGSSLKTEILLRELPQSCAYVPVDVSPAALEDATQRLTERFPYLDVRPIVGDFSRPIAFPADIGERSKTGFFPGSTIGNLTPIEAGRLLAVLRNTLSPGGRLIVGVDLKKDLRTLLPAYNDAAGVTAAFNLNLLVRINRELGGSFDLDAFRHEAIYNARDSRIEMHLVEPRHPGRNHRRSPAPLPRRKAHPRRELLQYSVRQFQDLARSSGSRPGTSGTTSQPLSVHLAVTRSSIPTGIPPHPLRGGAGVRGESRRRRAGTATCVSREAEQGLLAADCRTTMRLSSTRASM